MAEFGPNCVKPSKFVGSPSPDPGPDRMAGVTSMTPIISNGMTSAVKQSDNSSKSGISPLLNAALADLDPTLARGVRDVVARKGRS